MNERVRLNSAYTVINKEQRVNPGFPSQRMRQEDGLNAAYVKRQLLPNTLAVYDRQGRLSPVRTVDTEMGKAQYVTTDEQTHLLSSLSIEPSHGAVHSINDAVVDEVFQGGLVVNMSPFGEYHVMFIHMDPNTPTLVDIPEHILSMQLQRQASIIDALREDRQSAYWAVNVSPASLQRGLQSIFFPHSHVFSFDQSLDDLTPEIIKQVRSKQTWDYGISNYLGKQVIAATTEDVKDLYPQATLQPDPMGFTITMPEVGTADLAGENFTDFLKVLFRNINTELQLSHNAIFDSELEDVLQYVQTERTGGKIDLNTYGEFFREKPQSADDSSLTKRLRALYHKKNKYGLPSLKRPPGWSGTMQFREEGAFMAVTFGISDGLLTPVHSLGINIERSSESLPQEDMDRKITTVYEKL